MKELWETVKIVLLCVGAAILYGIVHDQITARICVAYFSIAHPPVFGDLKSPTLLGLGWGVIATWWVGLILGVPLGICARVGRLPKLDVWEVARAVRWVLGILLLVAMLVGMFAYMAYRNGALAFPEVWENAIPAEHHAGFVFDAAAHLTSYGAGALMGMGLWIWVLTERWRRNGAVVGR